MSDMRLAGFTLAVTKMEQMVRFYSEVFGARFEPQEMFGSTLYHGSFLGLDVLFCPAALAQNEAKQNRHQFDVIVPNLDDVIEPIKANGGELMGEVAETETEKTIAAYDPDRNSIVFKELK